MTERKTQRFGAQLSAFAAIGLLFAVWTLMAAPVPFSKPEADAFGLRRALRWDAGRSVSVAFTPSGALVALGDDETGIVQVRRLPTGTLVAKVRTRGLSGRTPSCLTLRADGKILAAISADGTAHLHGVGDRKLLDLGKVVRLSISPVAFHPDGKTLATFATDDVIRYHGVASGGEVGTPLPVGDNADALAFSPDGKTIAAGFYHGKPIHQVAIWDVASGKHLRRLGFLDSRTSALAFSPDGKYLAGADQNGNLKLWSTATGKLLHDLKGHTDYITALAFTPDGKTLASGARMKGDSTIRLWDVASGEQRAMATCPRGVWAMAVGRDGRTLYSGSSDGTIRLWEVPARWKPDPVSTAR
jgi:WD40 repeat protein